MIFNICGNKKRPEVAKKKIIPATMINDFPVHELNNMILPVISNIILTRPLTNE